MSASMVIVGAILLCVGVAIGWLMQNRTKVPAPSLGSEEAYRSDVRRRYAKAFELHRTALELIKPAVGSERRLESVVHVTLDMLMTQAYKTHYAVSVLAERGHVEDAATLTRRLMELAVQAVYIGAESEDDIRVRRAGAYLAHLWRSSETEARKHLPAEIVQEWERIYTAYQGELKSKTRWGPRWDQMFEALGLGDTYTQDYSLLSGVAHGSTPEALMTYSMSTVPIRSHYQVPTLLHFSTRYYLAVAGQWNNYFRLVPEERFSRLADLLSRY